MKVAIHYLTQDDAEDHVVIEAETVDEIRAIADKHIERVAGKNPWSQVLDDGGATL